MAGRTARENDLGVMCGIEIPMNKTLTLKVAVQGAAELCDAARSAAEKVIERFPG